MADKLFSANNHGMAGVVSTLESDDQIGVLGQQINNFAFTLVTPLGTNDHYIRHVALL